MIAIRRRVQLETCFRFRSLPVAIRNQIVAETRRLTETGKTGSWPAQEKTFFRVRARRSKLSCDALQQHHVLMTKQCLSLSLGFVFLFSSSPFLRQCSLLLVRPLGVFRILCSRSFLLALLLAFVCSMSSSSGQISLIIHPINSLTLVEDGDSGA